MANIHEMPSFNSDGDLYCSRCKSYQNINEFWNNKGKEYRANKALACKTCERKRSKEKRIRQCNNDIETFLKASIKMSHWNAQKRKLVYEISLKDLLNLWEKQNGICALSGESMTHIRGKGRVITNVSIDRIDSKKGYIVENIQLVCQFCNFIKNEFTDTELINWCKKIVEYNNEKRK
jgi:hypothetical protein